MVAERCEDYSVLASYKKQLEKILKQGMRAMTNGLPVQMHHFCTWRRFLVSFLQTSATVTLDRVAAPLASYRAGIGLACAAQSIASEKIHTAKSRVCAGTQPPPGRHQRPASASIPIP